MNPIDEFRIAGGKVKRRGNMKYLFLKGNKIFTTSDIWTAIKLILKIHKSKDNET